MVIIAAGLFLCYFASSLTDSRNAAAASLAARLRPAADSLVTACAWAALLQLCAAGVLCWAFPAHADSALVPLYAAGYACVAILAASQRRRPLKGRMRMEIEAGEGERHSVMAQGGRLAARNYAWAILTLHLALQAVGGWAAAAGGGGGGWIALAAGPVLAGSGGGGGALHVALAAVCGVLAVLFVAAGWAKFADGGGEQQLGQEGWSGRRAA